MNCPMKKYLLINILRGSGIRQSIHELLNFCTDNGNQRNQRVNYISLIKKKKSKIDNGT